MNKHFFIAQRVSAMLLAPLVIIHIVLIVYAVRNGLTADEILSRTRGNWAWGIFYSLFVIAASVHAPIGVSNILREWTSLKSRTLMILSVALFVLLLTTGFRAVFAVVAS